jgi:hypothetical protein
VNKFPTGKPHISFSEVKMWHECGWRHKLVHIDKIDVFKPAESPSFGTAVHEECEEFLEKRTYNVERLTETIKKTWEQHNFEKVDDWINDGKVIMSEIADFLNTTFPDWSFIAAEQALYEPIEGEEEIKFKGFVDGMIRAKNKRGQDCLWIIDWKTAGPRGWNSDKRRDKLVLAQLALYKHFCSEKFEIDPKDIKCGFILLKRGVKPGKACELFEISTGPKTLEDAKKLVDSMIKGVRAGKAIKNRLSCKYCDFKGTSHCPGSGEFSAFT